MVSSMESDEARRQLHEIERGEAASWLHFADYDRWQPLAFGVWASTFVLSLGLLDGSPRSLATLALITAPWAYVAWDRQRRAVYPSGPMPPELRRSTWALVALSIVVAILSSSVYFAAGAWAAALAAGVATAGAVELYGRVYAADAERVRRRLT